MTCSVPRCDNPARLVKSGLCYGHYYRWHRHGDLLAHLPLGNRGGSLPPPHLPFAPLRAHAPNNKRLAIWISVAPRTVLRWKVSGIPLPAAENACEALGLHPTEVWGDEYLFAAGCPVARLVASVVR